MISALLQYRGVLRLFIFFSLILSLLTAARPSLGTQKELVIVAWEIPYGLDPTHEFTPGYLHSVGALEYLLRLKPDSQIEPELAESYRLLDKNTWEIKLKPGITFWSGKKVDAKAIKASLERSRKLAPQAGSLLAGISIRTIDPLTVHFITEQPHPNLPLNLTNQWLGIHNAQSYGPEKNPFDLSVMDLTGYFQVVDFKPKHSIILERWEYYQSQKPLIDRIVYRQISEPQSRAMAMLSGEAHVARNISETSALLFKDQSEVDLVEIVRPSLSSIYLNVQAPILSDVRVRKALAWAINRPEMIELAHGGYGKVASCYFGANPSYPDVREVGYIQYNPDKAQLLLEEAGWKMTKGGVRKKDQMVLKIRLLSFGTNKPASELLQHYWGAIGVEVEIQHSPDYGIVQSKRSEGDWEAVIEGWGTFPAHQQLWRHFSPEGDINYGAVDDPEIDQILTKLSVAMAPNQHKKLVYQANQWIIDTVPIIPLYSRVALKAVNKSVKNLDSHFFYWQYEVNHDTDIGP